MGTSPHMNAALDNIERCPSCGAWTYWDTIAYYLDAHGDPHTCHHPTTETT